jgi:hypothetical protein
MIGTIQALDFSSGGKPKLKVDGSYFFVRTHDNCAVGRRIDYDARDFQLHNKWFKEITRFAVLPPEQQSTQQDKPVQASNAIPATAQPPAPEAAPKAPELVYTEPELRFISNVVGQAIYGGVIKEPEQIAAWFDAAKAVLGFQVHSGRRTAVEQSALTKKANQYAERINDAVRHGKESEMMSIWAECKDPASEDFECAVFALLTGPVKNRIRDLEQPQSNVF